MQKGQLKGRLFRFMRAGALLGAIVVPSVLVATPASAQRFTISTTTTDTFTYDQGSYNPTLTGTTFAVRALECDRVADVHPTGKVAFTDVTTGASIGTAKMVPSKQFVNCSQAVITDHESLIGGNYTIQATYQPGGTIPVASSSPATYVETLQ